MKKQTASTSVITISPDNNEDDINSHGIDLTEKFYKEIKNQNITYTKLEQDILTLKPAIDKDSNRFIVYDNCASYGYKEIKKIASSISEESLRKKIMTLLNKSHKKYLTKTSELKSLFDQVSANNEKLNDNYKILKIVLTLPILEKYQKENLPDIREYNNLSNAQEQLIERTEKLIIENVKKLKDK